MRRRDPTASKKAPSAVAIVAVVVVSVATAAAAAASITTTPLPSAEAFAFHPPPRLLVPRRVGDVVALLPSALRPSSCSSYCSFSRARRGRGTATARASIRDRRRDDDDVVDSDGLGVGASFFGDDEDDDARRGRGRGERRGRGASRDPRGTDRGGDERERGRRTDSDGFGDDDDAGRRRGTDEDETRAGSSDASVGRRRRDDRRADDSDYDDFDYDYYGARREVDADAPADDDDDERPGRRGRGRWDDERDARASDGRSDDDGGRDRNGQRGGGGGESDVPSGSESKRRAGHYDVYFDNRYGFRYDDPYEDERDEAERASEGGRGRREPRWETHGSTSVLLPPPDVEPASIVHFVGGTLFGSLPVQFYGPMLEGIALRTDAVVVATPVPVTIDENPLDHLRLAERICENFCDAYEYVVSDEYGPDVADELPIVGIGHSLGARIQTLIGTDARLTRGGFARDGCVLISFNNYNAGWSVPGVKSLRDRSEDVEREAEEGRRRRKARDEERRREERPRRGAGYRDNDFDDDEFERGDFFGFREGNDRNGHRSRSRGRRRREAPPDGERQRRSSSPSSFWDRYYDDDDFDDDDEEDYDLRDLLDDLRSSISARTSTIRAALTPRPSRLEFRPAPRRLWDALENGRYGESVPKTLVVQFDRDEIDQGSRLARSVVSAAKARSDASDLPPPDDDKDGDDATEDRRAPGATLPTPSSSPPPDVKFARLSGTHLTPVSLDGKNAWGGSILRLASSASDAMLAALTAAAGEEEAAATATTSASRPRDERRRKRNEADDLVSTVSIWMEEIVHSKGD